MYKGIFTLAALLCLQVSYAHQFLSPSGPPVKRTTYYVDNTAGNDANDGKSMERPWLGIERVNAAIFQPGDSILFKAGGMWTGTLKPQGSGLPGHPIVIGSYAKSTARPIINGNGALLVVHLQNVQYVELTNLEITNPVNPNTLKRGIEVENVDQGKLTHIVLRNNFVHDIAGDNSKGKNGSAGILVVARRKAAMVPSWYDSVLVEGNIVKNVNRTGIGTNSEWYCRASVACKGVQPYRPHTNVVIRNNYVENAGGDGIVASVSTGTLVEYNMLNGANTNSGQFNAGIWSWDGDNNLFQFNEAYNVKTTKDGEGFDIDYGQDSTIFQYNYSHDNEGGFMVVCTPGPNLNTNGIIRYNISQNDRERIIHLTGAVSGVLIHNNTFYLPEGETTTPVWMGKWNNYPVSASFYNNIFYLKSARPWKNWDSLGNSVFEHNIIYGAHTAGEPKGKGNLTIDPQLMAPGMATSGSLVNGIIHFGNVDGYKLKKASPALRKGKVIPNNGSRDYWGNPVSATETPNIGAYNGKGER